MSIKALTFHAMLFWCLFVLCIFTVSNSTDYYDLLGISKDADNREIRRAFKQLALKLHPDKVQGEDSHEKFIAINKAYEVLKDENTRKKYDLYGEEGLKEDFGSSWKGNYKSWNYYSESFGIYDDDPEIVTLNKNDFTQSIQDSSEIWFVNFYSPQCSHCHHLASTWRELSIKLLDVVRIGAVNCEEEWMLCRQQNIYSYPSLILYPKREKYQGSRDIDSLIDFALQHLPDYTITLSPANINNLFSKNHKPEAWVYFNCQKFDCYDSNDLKMLSSILKGLVNVATVFRTDDAMCKILDCKVDAAYFSSLNLNGNFNEFKDLSAFDQDFRNLAILVLQLLPDPNKLSEEKLKYFLDSKDKFKSLPKLVQFIDNLSKPAYGNVELKRLKALLPEVWLGYFNCEEFPKACSSLYIRKYPTFILFKGEGLYEFFYGRISVHGVVQFTKEVLLSQVQTLTPDNFPDVTKAQDTWFIDFFAPWCPPCMELLPHWRKTSHSIDLNVKFGTVDCSTHVNLCRKHNINSYPTTILYNQSTPHKYSGYHTHSKIKDFVEDIIHPSVVSLNPELFKTLVRLKKMEEIWVVDFFAPWCGPCQQLAPEWRKLAKMVKTIPFVRVGEVNCQIHNSICDEAGINSYPTIRLFPRDSTGIANFHTFNGRSRDAASIQGWMYEFLPSKVESLVGQTYKNMLSDTNPWVIDFFAPWCGHCQMFAPEFEKIAQAVEGKVKTGKVNCDRFPEVCRMAGVRAYPTVMFYEGRSGQATQNPIGDEIETLTYRGVYSFLDRRLGLSKNQHGLPKDEL